MPLLKLRSSVKPIERKLFFVFLFFMSIGAFIHFPDTAYRSLVLTLFNFLHYPAFLLLCLFITRQFRFPDFLSGFGPLLSTLVLASLLELLQPLLGRSATLSDFWVSSLGAFTGAWLVRLSKNLQSSKLKPKLALEIGLWLSLLSTSLFVLSQPVFHSASYLYNKYQAFPELSAHQLPEAKNFWFKLPQGKNSQTKMSLNDCPKALLSHSEIDNPQCIVVEPEPDRWSGLGQVLGISSWEGYQNLEVHVLSETTMTLFLRLDDVFSGQAYHQRFNREFKLNPGHNHLTIPLTDLAHLPKRDPLDLKHLRKIFLFTSPEEKVSTFFLYRIYLN